MVQQIKGLVLSFPVELIDDNGIHLKECVVKFAKALESGRRLPDMA